MKKKLLFIFLLISTVCTAQYQLTSSKFRYYNGIALSSRLDAAFGTADSLVLYTKLDSTLMFKYKGTPRALAYASQLSGYVPYTGATTSVNLGSYNLIATTIQASNILYASGLTNGKNIGLRFNSYQNRGIIYSKDNSTGLPILLGDTSDQSTVTIPATTDATSTTAASVMMAGGLAVAKKLYAAQYYGYRGASGATTPNSNVSGLILEHSAATGIAILTPDANASRLQFGTASNNSNGLIYSDYNSGLQTMLFQLGSGGTGALTKLGLYQSYASFTNRLNVNGAIDNSSYALNVNGDALITGSIYANNPSSIANILSVKSDADQSQSISGSGSGAGLFVSSSGYNQLGVLIGSSFSTGKGWIQAGRTDGITTNYDLSLNASGGNVLVGHRLNVNGATDDPAFKLNVSGNSFLDGRARIADQVVGDSSRNIYQQMANTDYWQIYGYSPVADKGEMIFKVGDNGDSYRNGGQRFRFYYDTTGGGGSGAARSPLIIDYDTVSTPNAFTAAGILGNSFSAQYVSGGGAGSLGVGKWVTQPESSSVTRTYFTGSDGSTNGTWEIYRATSTTPDLVHRFNSNGTETVFSLGTGAVYSSSGTLTNTDPSDSTIKNTINAHKYGLSEILKLQPKSFYYNSDSAKTSLKYGFIAQDVQKIMPDMVRKIDPKDDKSKLGLESQGIYVTLVKAIQEQQDIIDDLKKRIAALENK